MQYARMPLDWPNRAYSSQIDCRPHRWHVQQHGVGPTLLLLHGAGASTHSYRDLFADLSRDHHVVAIDLPGQGFTQPGARQRLGLEPMAQDVAALLAQMRLHPAAIIGHSAGAALALRLSQILQPQPQAIICINGALGNFEGLAGIVYPAMAKLMALNPLSASLFSWLSSSEARVRSLLTATGSAAAPDSVALYCTLVADRAHVDGTLGMMAQWNLSPLLRDLPTINLPVLFLTGGRDKAVPPETSRAAAAAMQNATLQQVEELGHMMHEEDPARSAAIIRAYLTQNGIAPALQAG